MEFTFFDIAIVLILIIFAIRGFVTGFCKGFFGIVGFIGGLWIAYIYYQDLSPYFGFIHSEAWRNIGAYVCIFLFINIITSCLAHVLKGLLGLMLLPWLDMLVGLLLGLLKGFLLASLLAFVAQNFFYDSIQGSMTLPHLNMAMEYIRNMLPPDIVNLQL